MIWKSKKINEVENQQIDICFAWLPLVMTNGDCIWLEQYTRIRKYHFSNFWGFKWFVINREAII